MAIRTIRENGDEILEKKCKEVKEITPRLRELIDDMLETMHEAGGVGLAAPQVGVLKQIIVIDIAGEDEEPDPIVLVNPKLLLAEGEQRGYEGCLSIPGYSGIVTRPAHVIVRAYDENMQVFEKEATELLARAICHEIDHLDGIMYTTKIEGELKRNEDLTDEDLKLS